IKYFCEIGLYGVITKVRRINKITNVPAASPIDLECHIQCERITKILDDAIYKCKLSLCLPELVQDYRILYNLLTPPHMDDLTFIFEQYDNPLFSASLMNVAVMEDLKAQREIQENDKSKLMPGFEFLMELEHFRDLMNIQILLKEETERFEQMMAMKEELINKLEHELVILNQEASVKLKKKMFKVETQLLSWLQKYDLEMSDKQVELDEFTQKHEEEVEKCQELEKQLAEQDIEYIPLMAEREAEYNQEMTEKMNKFLLDHAARVIQHAWREVLVNRAEKKKRKFPIKSIPILISFFLQLRKIIKRIQAAQVPTELIKGKGKK
ncbi:hypothetical protein HF086_015375, partial [Spodoptera exigua]